MARLRTLGPGGEDEQDGGGIFGPGGLAAASSQESVDAPYTFERPAQPLFNLDNYDPIMGRQGETGRERGEMSSARREPAEGGISMVTPRRPSVPTPSAGATSVQPSEGEDGGSPGSPQVSPRGAAPMPPMQGVVPFSPMGSSVVPGQGGYGGLGLRGSMGGQMGGGIGVPFDPTPNSQSDPISTLLQLLMRGGGG